MEPAVKPAAINTRTGAIGVLATKGTFKGELYLRTLHKFASNATVIEQVGEGLVELVESGNTDTPQARELIGKYVVPMLEKNVDHIVLGCTHYPFLERVIKEFTPCTALCPLFSLFWASTSPALRAIAGAGFTISTPSPANSFITLSRKG